jgi:hypothetical protein
MLRAASVVNARRARILQNAGRLPTTLIVSSSSSASLWNTSTWGLAASLPHRPFSCSTLSMSTSPKAWTRVNNNGSRSSSSRDTLVGSGDDHRRYNASVVGRRKSIDEDALATEANETMNNNNYEMNDDDHSALNSRQPTSHYYRVDHSDLKGFLTRNHLRYKESGDKITVCDCPFCKPTGGKPDNQWKLYIWSHSLPSFPLATTFSRFNVVLIWLIIGAILVVSFVTDVIVKVHGLTSRSDLDLVTLSTHQIIVKSFIHHRRMSMVVALTDNISVEPMIASTPRTALKKVKGELPHSWMHELIC